MAAAVQVFGPALIKVGTGSVGALESLGYTRQAADIRSQGFFLDVPGDENGGDQGPPIDIQYLGEIARVRLELTKWDEVVAAKVRSRLAAGTEGTPGTAGTLMFGGSKSIRVLVHSTTGPMNFPRAFLRDPWEIAKGTRYSTLVLEFEAHKDGSGILYNALVT
jgi:hypothetical protein